MSYVPNFKLKPKLSSDFRQEGSLVVLPLPLPPPPKKKKKKKNKEHSSFDSYS